MKLKGIYEANGEMKGLPESLLHTLCTNSINLKEMKNKKVKEEKVTLRH